MTQPSASGAAAGTPAPAALTLERLLHELSRPAAYPEPVCEVRLVQTHASCVFLTGCHAYKIKKPLNLGFLDYTSLDKRRYYCERELLLNRRLCPEVYLDLVRVVEAEGGLRFDTVGTPVEWAVRMRQLPEADLLPRRLAARSVSTDDLRQVARILTRFHAAAATDAGIAGFGAPEVVRRNLEENFAQTMAHRDGALPPEHLHAIREYSFRYLDRNRRLFHRRMADGRIRDGHGDLRAQNIALCAPVGEGVQIFDCIEFNDRFRYGDVASDLAYLAMDLDLAGRADLRTALVDEYVALSDDGGLRELLSFYRCYRAYVRGKIALLAAAEREIPAPEREEHQSLAAAAFDLARSYAECRPAPALFLMVGYSGSGKSTLAQELARRLPAVRLSSDDARKEQAGVARTRRLPEAAYTAAARAAVYETLRRRAAAHLERKEHVILDATFLSAPERASAAALAATAGAECWVVRCDCPDPVIRARLGRREHQRGEASDAGTAVYEAQRRRCPTLPAPEDDGAAGGRWVTVHTDQAPAPAARELLRVFWSPAGSE